MRVITVSLLSNKNKNTQERIEATHPVLCQFGMTISHSVAIPSTASPYQASGAHAPSRRILPNWSEIPLHVQTSNFIRKKSICFWHPMALVNLLRLDKVQHLIGQARNLHDVGSPLSDSRPSLMHTFHYLFPDTLFKP